MNTNTTNNTIEVNFLPLYTQHLTTNGKSTNTIKSYTHDIELFFNHFNLSPSIVQRDQVIRYKDYLLNTKNNDAKTVNRILSAIKSYNEFLVLDGLQENLVVLSQDYRKVQKSSSSPVKVSTPEVFKFLNKLKDNEPYRNYAIAVVLANTGLRISEILNIKLNKLVTLKDDELTIIGKGNKQRLIIVNPKAIGVIKEYIANHRSKSKYASESEYLFVSNKGEKLNTFTIQRIFNKYSNKITPHQLRHRYASDILENKIWDVRQLQDQLGHAQLNTVMIYTHTSKEKMKENLSGFSIG